MGTSRCRLTVPTGRSGRSTVVRRCLDLLRSLESRPRGNGPAGEPAERPRGSGRPPPGRRPVPDGARSVVDPAPARISYPLAEVGGVEVLDVGGAVVLGVVVDGVVVGGMVVVVVVVVVGSSPTS